MKTIVSLAVSTAAALTATQAAAANQAQLFDDGSYRIAVSYDDLNLSSEAGKRTLEGRLRAAAGQVCGTAMNLDERRAADRCRADFATSARPQVAFAERAARGGMVEVAEGR